MAADHIKLLFICLSFILSFIFIKLAQADNYIIHMDHSAMPKVFASRRSWYMSTLSSLSGNTNATIPAAEPIYSYNHFIGLNPKTGLWPASGFGKDVIIGVVDTGVWPESESFNDEGMGDFPAKWKGQCENGTQFSSSLCNKKLIGARSFDKGLIANINISMNSPRDTAGHGTHTSSTAAGAYVSNASYFGYAEGTARGMAPRNEGPDLGTLHNGIPWVLTVAAGAVDRTLGASLRLGTDVFVNGEVLYPGNFSSSQFPIVFMDACDDIDELKKVAGNIVVCQDPGIETSLNVQFKNIQAAGNAAGVFITNNTHLDIFIQSPFPAIFLEQKDGDVVLGYIKTNKTPKELSLV
ncbi:hypothetical protein V6N13_075457 [Hibiscus sabdariffa]